MQSNGQLRSEENHVGGEWLEPTAGLQIHSTSSVPVQSVQVFGQRCSGTNVVSKLVAANFGPAAVTDRYGFKHWFVPEQVLFPGDVLAIVVARDPFDWIRSLHRQPWHAHPELKALGFSDFIRAEWHSYWDGEFAGIDPSHPMLNREMLHERDPATGRRFANALRKRTAKLRSWSELAARCNHVCLLDQAMLVSSPDLILDAIAAAMQREPERDLDVLRSYKGNGFNPFVPRRYESMTPEDTAFVRSQLDPDVERRFGFDIGRSA